MGGADGLSDKLRKGDQVEARYPGREKYYKGTISRDHGDGTYGLDFAATAKIGWARRRSRWTSSSRRPSRK